MRPEVAHFNEVSTPYAKEYGRTTTDGHSFRVRRTRVLELLPQGAKQVLDLASGPGVMIKDLRARGAEVTCVDAAPEMIAIAKQVAAGDPHVACEVGDAYQLRLADGSFDATIAMGLIEYLEHEEKFLAESARILRPGGTFIVTFPNWWSPWRIFNRAALSILSLVRKGRGGITHREYTYARARQLLERGGFSAERPVYYNFKLIPYPLDRLLPWLVVGQSVLCEWLRHTPLRFIGTGFIIKATKR